MALARWIVLFTALALALGAPAAWGEDDAGPDPAGDIVLPTPGPPGDGPYFFYHGRDFGSEALVHPLRLIINGGYGITQIENRDNRLGEIDYANGWRNVWKNLSHPVTAIEARGWRDFFEREIIPVSINSGRAQYWPNYTQHLIGGGMSYRLYLEWYRYHGYPTPRFLSIATLSAYHLLNEVVENDTYDGWTTDPIADLYIFDPLSMVLFSSERVCGFFANTLHMADWSYQPSINPATGRLENNGQNFAMKLALPWTDHWRLFYHFGTHGEGGLSYLFPNGESVSVAAGLKAQDLLEIAEGVQTVNFGVAGGIFYDRENSLLASLLFAKSKDYRIRFNVYPGWLGAGGFAPGFFVADGRETGVVWGVTLNVPTVLPLGMSGGL
jgi:hypothetical protein